MIYKVFASSLDTVEKIKAFKNTSLALEVKYYTDFVEIEANSKCEAYMNFAKIHSDLLDSLGYTQAYFFCVDKYGDITQ